jgi:hypothetical protein
MVDFSHHATVAARASIANDLVVLPANIGVAGIQRFCRIFAKQPVTFPNVEPDAMTVVATIDLDSLKFDRLHAILALRTFHKSKNTSTCRAFTPMRIRVI